MIVHAHYPLGETRVQREAAALTEVGYQVDVICLRGHGEAASEVVDGVSVRRLPVARHRGSGMIVQLLEYVAFLVMAAAVVGFRHLRRRYRSVQTHNLPDFLVFSAIVPKLTRTPIILDIHDLMPEFFRARAGVDADHLLSRLVALEERASIGFADHVVTVTEGWRRVLVERGASEAETSVVMNSPDPRIFTPRQGLPADETFTVVYHGTFTERYGVLVLLEAMAELRRSVPSARLLLLGDGDARPEMVATIDRLGLGDVVTMSEGMVDARRLPPLLSTAAVGVVPNLSNEFTDGLLPTKLLEYVALGIPVVAARTPMITAAFDERQVAFFEPGDVGDLVSALEKLHANPDLGSSLASSAARFDVEHGWTAESARYVALLRRLAAARA